MSDVIPRNFSTCSYHYLSDFKSSNVLIFSFSFSFLRKYFEHCIFTDSFFLKTGLWFIILQVSRCKKNGGASKSPELKLINVLVKIQALLALSRWRQRPRSTRAATPLWLLYDHWGYEIDIIMIQHELCINTWPITGLTFKWLLMSSSLGNGQCLDQIDHLLIADWPGHYTPIMGWPLGVNATINTTRIYALHKMKKQKVYTNEKIIILSWAHDRNENKIKIWLINFLFLLRLLFICLCRNYISCHLLSFV